MNIKLIQKFISDVSKKLSTTRATEHTFRSNLEELIGGIANDIVVINEPKRIECGAPDLAILQKSKSMGFVEAKSPTTSLSNLSIADEEQKQRYTAALSNLIYTNCLDWELYCYGRLVKSVTIAKLDLGKVVGIANSFTDLEKLFQEFLIVKPQNFESPEQIAISMARKTQLIQDAILKSLNIKNDPLVEQYTVFKQNLVGDYSKKDFADVYAETITYGLFTAKMHLKKGKFDRYIANSLIPISNPFLRKFFSFVSNELPEGVSWIIDELVDDLNSCDLDKLMQHGVGHGRDRNDAFIYFYETFLGIYNPKKKEKRGVYYTPLPVVKYIVRAVDEVLKKEFGLFDGLANTDRTAENNEFHKVQILDPAAGTGTFLAEIINYIGNFVKKDSPALISDYIKNSLIPRIHGFELLMAPYSMCHLKLEMMYKELGYEATADDNRLSIFLTDSLKKGESIKGQSQFASWLTAEAEGAKEIKLKTPIMCIVGNPPYLGEGGKPSKWMEELINDYKLEPDSQDRLKERNYKWLNDLYVQFIRLSSFYIEKNGEGVLGFVTNHGYIDNPTFRGMRRHLLDTFDKIWILDLKGNARRDEVKKGHDENVFDILQGVSIIIATRNGKKEKGAIAEIRVLELSGRRDEKYRKLLDYEEISLDQFVEIFPRGNQYYFKNWDYDSVYFRNSFKIIDLMPVNSVGMRTAKDKFVFANKAPEIEKRIKDLIELEPDELLRTYEPQKLRRGDIHSSKMDVGKRFDHKKVLTVNYRPFDPKITYYTGKTNGLIHRPSDEISQYYLEGDQIGLLFTRQVRDFSYSHVFVTEFASESSFLSSAGATNARNAPLYLYDNESIKKRSLFGGKINFDTEIFDKIVKSSTNEECGAPNELQVFDYIYGVLNCPDYRREFENYLKADYPRVPYPSTPEEFWDISKKGSKLRNLHLMKTKDLGPMKFPQRSEKNDNEIRTVKYEDSKIFINDDFYFDEIPSNVAYFYIGGYQPAFKWLKDRKGQVLNYEDSVQYRKVLMVLEKSDQIMQTIKFM